jgi:HlyD family secretion protein
MPHPNPRMLIPLAVLSVLGIAGYYLERKRDAERSVLSGFFESQPIEVASRINGRASKILVKEGDTVTAGQTLVIFEAHPSQSEAEAKSALAEQAREQLREVMNGPRQEDIRKQDAAIQEARAALDRLKNGPLSEEIRASGDKARQADAMYQKALAGPRSQERDQAIAAERAARAKLAQAERGLTEEERAQFRARFDAAQNQELLAQKEFERYDALKAEGAVSGQQLDKVRTDLREAKNKRDEMQEALQRAERGMPKEELDEARNAYKQAKAAMELILAGTRKDDIEAARAEASGARENLKLLLRGSRKEDIQVAEARLLQAQSALEELRRGNREEVIRQAEAASRAAQATAEGAQTNLEERNLRAPRDGVVERLLIANGALVAPGTSAIRMSDPTDLWLRVYLPESKMARVKVGDNAELRVDGVSDSVQAMVESIATKGEFTPANLQSPEERGKQVFAIRLRLKRIDSRVKSGMYATVKRMGQWP